MADSIKNMSPKIIIPEGGAEEILRLDIPAAAVLNESGIMHAGLTRVGSGYKVSRFHVCKHFIIFVIAGTLHYYNSDDELCRAEAGERVIMPISYQQHYWSEGELVVCWFHLHSLELWKKMNSAVIAGARSLWFTDVYDAVCKYIRESGSEYRDSSEVAGHYAGLICKYLEREINGGEIKLKVTDQEKELERLMQEVEADLARHWSVRELADMIYVSTAQLYRMVQVTYRASPMQLVREMRLAKARELLCSSEMLLGNIAEEVGYESAFALSKAFKKHFNVTPADVRKQSGVEK